MSPQEKLAAFPEALEAYEFALASKQANHVPTPEELGAYWVAEYDPLAVMSDTKDVYGVMRRPERFEAHWAVASIDLCEVTRETCSRFMQLGGFTLDHAGETYGYGLPFGISDDPDAVTRMVQTIMIRDEVQPVAGIDDIQAILQNAHEHGVYVVANTSTLPGCELATVNWLAKYLPNCFDGIVLPRNHDGLGSTTKGTAKASVVEALNVAVDDKAVRFTMHIDDAPHHIRAVRETVRDFGIDAHSDATPRYIWNQNHADMNHFDTPLECFEALHDTIEAQQRAS